jgi:hypothetical protein
LAAARRIRAPSSGSTRREKASLCLRTRSGYPARTRPGLAPSTPRRGGSRCDPRPAASGSGRGHSSGSRCRPRWRSGAAGKHTAGTGPPTSGPSSAAPPRSRHQERAYLARCLVAPSCRYLSPIFQPRLPYRMEGLRRALGLPVKDRLLCRRFTPILSYTHPVRPAPDVRHPLLAAVTVEAAM